MKVVRILATLGVLFIMIGLGEQMIQYQEQIDKHQEEIKKYKEEIKKLKVENKSLWNNYYMNVSNYEGYEYYE